jgi:osmotically-inducible protein OsmY
MPKLLLLFALTAGLMLEAGSVQAERTTPRTLLADSKLENTERNVRDSGDTTLTPEDQKETAGDRHLTAAIRRSVVNDKSLSLDAHNAKIITRNGTVTLRGPVENSAEKVKLQSIAQKMRGVKHVDNQLETKTP